MVHWNHHYHGVDSPLFVRIMKVLVHIYFLPVGAFQNHTELFVHTHKPQLHCIWYHKLLFGYLCDMVSTYMQLTKELKGNFTATNSFVHLSHFFHHCHIYKSIMLQSSGIWQELMLLLLLFTVVIEISSLHRL